LTDLGGGQKAFVATPEKALLDLVHLQPGGDAPDYLRELRLQNLDRLDVDECDGRLTWPTAPNCAGQRHSWQSWRALRHRSTKCYEGIL
jgi:hypothetical protein